MRSMRFITAPAIMTLVLACTDSMPTDPEPGSYLIGAYLTPDLGTAVVSVKRQVEDEPSALTCTVLLDGKPMPLSTCCSADSEATFMLEIEPQYGHSYTLAAVLGDKNAAGVLTTPAKAYTTILTTPPADSLFFEPWGSLSLSSGSTTVLSRAGSISWGQLFLG